MELRDAEYEALAAFGVLALIGALLAGTGVYMFVMG